MFVQEVADMEDMMKAFKEYAKEQFGCDISFEKTLTPDTFESLFGVSFINQNDDTFLSPEGHQENISYSNNIAKVNCLDILYDNKNELHQEITIAAQRGGNEH